MGEPRIRVHDSGLGTDSRHDPVNRPQRHRTLAIAQKDRSAFPTADEEDQITEILVIDDRNDPGFAAFTFMDRHAFAFHINVSNIEMDEFVATNAEPPEGFNQTSIPKIVGAKE